MARKKQNTANYGVSSGRSIGIQLLGGGMVVITVLFGLLAFNSFTAGI